MTQSVSICIIVISGDPLCYIELGTAPLYSEQIRGEQAVPLKCTLSYPGPGAPDCLSIARKKVAYKTDHLSGPDRIVNFTRTFLLLGFIV